MTDEQKILLALVKLMFPREMLDYFEVVGFELQEAYGNNTEENEGMKCHLCSVW